MKTFNSKLSTTLAVGVFFLFTTVLIAQTKKLKRPTSRVKVASVDKFVQNSFDIYDKVYMYDGYAEQGKELTDDDIDVLENALDDLADLSDSAPNIVGDLDGVGVLKQGKATLQINRAKKALKYSIKTAKELLAGQRERDEKGEESDDEMTSGDGNDDDNNSSSGEGDSGTNESNEEPEAQNISDNLEINSKFDFVPGDKLLFFDDFSQDFIGDFPSKWNTNGSGELVTFNNNPEKWLELKYGYNTFFIPDLPDGLPESYTIEFDVAATGMDRNTSSGATLNIRLEDNNTFKTGKNNVKVRMPFVQYTIGNFNISNKLNNTNPINNAVKADIRKAVLNQPHVSIAVNKQRYRLWVNQQKYIDVPRMIAEGAPMKSLKFGLYGFREGVERVFIRNLKIAEGGVDLRRKLMAEGKISTNGILFDSGSANIKTQSYGIIRQISQVLMQDSSIKLNIIGHTDADGGDEANMMLSQKRAEAVKNALINVYKIDASRLASEGKGESEPVADNTTTEGKAQNRRVEFIKM